MTRVSAEPEQLRSVVVPLGAEDAVSGEGRTPNGHQRRRVRALQAGVQRSLLRPLLPCVGSAETLLPGESAHTLSATLRLPGKSLQRVTKAEVSLKKKKKREN